MKTKYLTQSDSDLRAAAELLRLGQLVAFPTETVFGLGACCYNEQAVARIFEAKERPLFDPLIVHISTLEMALELWTEINGNMLRLMERFWPGPLTIVAGKKDVVPDLVTAGLDTVAVRFPDHQVARRLIGFAGFPVAAPSANRFGHVSPTRSEHVRDELSGRIAAIVEGETKIGLESTVVRFVENRLLVLRPGGITVEELKSEFPDTLLADEFQQKYSPGHSTRHYAPEIPLILFSDAADLKRLIRLTGISPQDAAAIYFREALIPEIDKFLILSHAGDLSEAAAGLFPALRHFKGKVCLFAQKVPEHGLGLAINDRLRRAAGGK
ncbi:MAG: L-threonylcarbamoyladenylate synthase [Candidatus Wallbacteria bacterium]|nr:L-threonylcarbamoyladenylate synthase [Candidatus Wallbacteria bacterium]